jgi:hypothetical protein
MEAPRESGRNPLVLSFSELSRGAAGADTGGDDESVGEGVGGDVGGGGGTNSNAPMLQCDACGRATPRWSVASGLPSSPMQPAASPAPIAALPPSNATVSVGPPLACKGPKSRLALLRSPGPSSLH